MAAVGPVFKPMISKRKNSVSELKKHYSLATRWVFMITSPMAVTLFTAPELYISILFTPEYAAVGLTLAVLTLGYLFNAFFGPQSIMLQGLGHTRLTLLNTGIMISINAVLDFLLIPKFGVLGAGIGTATAITVTGVAGVTEIKILKGIHPFTKSLLKQWIAGIVSFTVAWQLDNILDGLPLSLILPPIVLVAYFGTLIAINGLSEDELMIAKKIDSHLGTSVLQKTISTGIYRE